MKPMSCCVVIAADSGSVFAMLWKDGKIEDRTTVAARPPQYAWIPKLYRCQFLDSVRLLTVRTLTR